MVQYDEKDICEKCGKKLLSRRIEYSYTHDGGLYDDSYNEVDREFAHKVGLGFYCNECYENIGNTPIDSIILDAKNFLNSDLQNAINELAQNYHDKLEKLYEVQRYVEEGIEQLQNKHTISDLSENDISYLDKHCYIYKPTYQEVNIGFCRFRLQSEIKTRLR